MRLQKESDIIDDNATNFETSERAWVLLPDACRGTGAKLRASAVQAKPRTIEKLSGADRELDNRDVAFLPRLATISQLNDVVSLVLSNILDFIWGFGFAAPQGCRVLRLVQRRGSSWQGGTKGATCPVSGDLLPFRPQISEISYKSFLYRNGISTLGKSVYQLHATHSSIIKTCIED